MKNNKCILILPFFGEFSNYFQLFLNSCGKNPSVHWLVFTDSEQKFSYPQNVRIVKMTLEEIRNRAVNKFGFDVRLSKPYKLCDYKPAYGFLFEEYIDGYDYWGHCDCDLIFGNLEKLLLPLLEIAYDKLFAAGHLTIYKNDFENNRRFMKMYHGDLLYKESFTTDDIYVFDEDFFDKNVHSIFLNDGARVFTGDLSMNTTIKTAKFKRSPYDSQTRSFISNPYVKARYYWDDGSIVSISLDEHGQILKKEYLYIHLQMRKMRMNLSMLSANIFEMLSDRFIKVCALPGKKRELRVMTIGFPYMYWLDEFQRRLKRKLKKK